MADNIDNQYNLLLSKLNDTQFPILSHKWLWERIGWATRLRKSGRKRRLEGAFEEGLLWVDQAQFRMDVV